MNHLLGAFLALTCAIYLTDAHPDAAWCASFGTIYCSNDYFARMCHHLCERFTPDMVINGNWHSWSVWTSCSKTCDHGQRTRARQCNSPVPAHGGLECLESNSIYRGLSEVVTQDCYTPCPVHGGFTEWTDWDTCPVTCGGGMQYRRRTCTNPVPQHGGRPCNGQTIESKACQAQTCPVHGMWSYWNSWSHCTMTCGSESSRFRVRRCDSPAPAHGGNTCPGLALESQKCEKTPCPQDGGYTTWSFWSACDKSCGRGHRYRTRCCTNPQPKFGGRDCKRIGIPIQIQACSHKPCALDAQWTSWSIWAACTKTCGDDGKQPRLRACQNPLNRYDGITCTGKPIEERTCNQVGCPVAGGWTDWSTWTPCDQTCGGGLRFQTKCCANPVPANGGAYCNHGVFPVKKEACNIIACPSSDDPDPGQNPP